MQGVNTVSRLKYFGKYVLGSFVITVMNLGIRKDK
jgi:hypothetical protein